MLYKYSIYSYNIYTWRKNVRVLQNECLWVYIYGFYIMCLYVFMLVMLIYTNQLAKKHSKS